MIWAVFPNGHPAQSSQWRWRAWMHLASDGGGLEVSGGYAISRARQMRPIPFSSHHSGPNFLRAFRAIRSKPMMISNAADPSNMGPPNCSARASIPPATILPHAEQSRQVHTGGNITNLLRCSVALSRQRNIQSQVSCEFGAQFLDSASPLTKTCTNSASATAHPTLAQRANRKITNGMESRHG